MKINFKSFISGVLVGSIGLTSAFATPITKNIKAIYSINNITIDGKSAYFPEDSKPFTVDGRTYLPVRALSEVLNKNVDYDNATATVKITSKDNGNNTDDLYKNYEYTIAHNQVTITKYKGKEKHIVIPSKIEGYPVTIINDYAFANADDAIVITVPSSVNIVGNSAFSLIDMLVSIYFEGDAPRMNYSPFMSTGSDAFTVYYHSNTRGWGEVQNKFYSIYFSTY